MSESVYDGGPAFPAPNRNHPGMTLRQWYAGQALTGYLAMQADPSESAPSPEECRKYCFKVADEMLKEDKPWRSVADSLPIEEVVVETKIDDKDGCRNEQPLKRRGSLWFFPDNSMYIYYIPTHWRPL